MFNEKGFIAPISIYDPDEIEDIRSYFDALLDRVIARGDDSYSISVAHVKLGRVYDTLRDPRIERQDADLLGENVIGWGAHFFAKCRVTASG